MAAPTKPATWKIFLANPEPSTHGTFRTSLDVRVQSVMRSKADVGYRPKQEQLAML